MSILPARISSTHKGGVSGLIQSDGACFLTWGYDGALAVWDNSGAPLSRVSGHGSAVWGFVPVGQAFVSWGADGGLGLWTWSGPDLRLIDRALHAAAVQGVAPLDRDDRFVSWGADGALRWWTIGSGELCMLSDASAHQGCINGARRLRDGRLVTWGWDGALRFWSAEGSALGAVQDAHEACIKGLLETASGDLLTWGWDGDVRILRPRGLVDSGKPRHRGGVLDVQPIGDWFVSIGTDSQLFLWAAKEGNLDCLDRASKIPATALCAIGDNAFVSGLRDGACMFWTINEGKLTEKTRADAHRSAVGGIDRIGEERLFSWAEDGSLAVWSVEGELQRSSCFHEGAVLGATQLASGVCASWGSDGVVCLGAGGALPPQPRSHYGRCSLALSTSGLLSSIGNDGRINNWDVEQRRLITSTHAHPGGVRGLRHLPRGRSVTWGWDGAVRFWDRHVRPERTEAGIVNEGPVWGLLALECRHLASWGLDGRVAIWNEDGRQTASGQCGKAIWGMAYTANTSFAWGPDGHIAAWQVSGETLTEQHRVLAHLGGTWGVATLGSRLLSWGEDGSFGIWQWEGAGLRLVRRVPAHRGGVWRVAILGPDKIASCGSDGLVRFWDASGSDLGASPYRHRGGVNGFTLLDNGDFLSWGVDGAISVLDTAGYIRAAFNDGIAHEGGVVGVKALADGSVVSWGWDGAIRWWDHGGAPFRSERAHRGCVINVEQLPGHYLVSCGSDGEVRFWASEEDST